MLWPIVLPFKIAFFSLAGLVLFITLCSPLLKWDRKNAFLISTILACLAFLPFCMGIKSILDAQRFGIFQYAAHDDVDDFRIERYLPMNARDITLDKSMMGHRVRYSISKTDFMQYLDEQWRKYGESSAISRDEMPNGTAVMPEMFNQHYGDLNWPPLGNAREYSSPIQGDGGGATYYFEEDSGMAYHYAGYW